MAKPYEVENYLTRKNLRFRRRGQKVELHTCPFCNGGDHKDFWKCVVYMDADGGNYKCMRGSCNVSGSFWQFVEHFGDDPKEHIEKSPFFTKERLAHKPIVFKTEPVTSLPLTDIALDYLHRRGFTDEVLEDVSIWCDDKGQVNFGYYHESQLCMVKVRQPRKPKEKEQKAWQAWKDGLRTLWGLEQCDFSHSMLFIVFGEYDRIALRQAGLDNVVSVPCGDNDLEWLNICYDQLAGFTDITLWIDNDKSGKEALPKIAERLGKHRVRVVKSDFKDANEMLVYRQKEAGAEAAYQEMWQTVAGAEWYWNGDIIEVSDIEETEQCFDGYLSGIPFLDKSLGGFLFHRMTVHLGDTKHGKTEAVTQIALRAIDQGGVVCVWTGEDSAEDYKYKVQVHLAGWEGIEVRHSKRSDRDYAWVTTAYKARIDEYLRGKMFFLNKRNGVTEDTLLENFELAYKRWGCNVFILDNLMKAVASKDTQNIHFRQTQIVNKYSDFTKTFRAHGHLVVHTNKTGDENEPPTRKSASGAKEIINLADNVIGWWKVPKDKQDQYNGAEATASILANRVFGEEGIVNLRYEQRIRRFAADPEDLNYLYKI